jgi:hypothetical protein
MTATLDTVADSYASIKIGHTQLWTANEAARQGRGCHWIVCPRRLLPDSLADAGRPAFSKIRAILSHRCSAMQDPEQPGGAAATELLLVEWFLPPLQYSQTGFYHPRVHVPVIGLTPRRSKRDMPLTAVPARDVLPVDVLVRRDPRGAPVQLVLPTNNDLYFRTAFGYDGPRLT